MKSIAYIILLIIFSFNAYANSVVLVDEKYNLGIPENNFLDAKYTITSSPTLTVDWSDYKFKRRLVTIVPVTVILNINNQFSYSANLEQGRTKIVLSEKNLKPRADAENFTGYSTGDNIDLSIGFVDLDEQSGNRYFISIWSAKVIVR